MYILNFSKFNKRAFVGERTIYGFHNARCNGKSYISVVSEIHEFHIHRLTQSENYVMRLRL